MAKFFRLVKNEYIKTLKRVSTKIMLVLVVLAAVALSGIAAFGKSQMSNEYYYVEDSYDYYQEQIDWLETTQPVGYENQLTLYEYLQEAGVELDDVRYEVAESLSATLEGVELVESLDSLFVNDDWQAVCEVLRDNTINEGDKWAYQYRIDNNIPFGDTWKDDAITQAAQAKTALAAVDLDMLSSDEAEQYREM